MNCHEVYGELELFVLGELPAAKRARVEAHLAACPDCRLSAEQYRFLVSEIKRSGAGVGPRPAFKRALWSVVDAEIRSEQVRPWRQAVLAVGSIAAMLLVGLAIWGVWTIKSSMSGPVTVHPSMTRPAPERWRYSGARAVPRSVAYGLVVQSSSMYVLCEDKTENYVAAVDTVTGQRLWRSPTPSLGYLAADESRVFCLASGAPRTLELVALDAVSGRVLWRYVQDISRLLWSPCHPLPLPGERVCWTVGNNIHMLDARTGEEVWSRSITGEGVLSRPAVKGENLYLASSRGLYCLQTKSGEEGWRESFTEELSGWGRPLLAVAGKSIYFVQMRGLGSRLGCMDLNSHELVWSKDVPIVQHLLATDAGVYLRGEAVLALDNLTGKPLWACAAVGCGPVTAVDGMIHFVDTSGRGRLVALDPDTGEKAWELTGLRSCDAFMKIDGTGYIKTRDGVIHAVALCDSESTAQRM